MVVIRLARRGAKKRPFYDVVVTDSRKPRDSGYFERVGYFNPSACGKETPLKLSLERVDYWIGQGGKPSLTVASLIKKSRKQQSTTSS